MKFQISYLLKMMIYTALFLERDKTAYVIVDLPGEYLDEDDKKQYDEAFQLIYDSLHNVTGIGFYSDFDVNEFRYKFLYEWMNTPENVSTIVEKADILLELFKGENDG